MRDKRDRHFVGGRGPVRAGKLLASRIRAVGESRGFAVTRLLTHWVEIAGKEIAGIARPVEVTFGRGFGATLTLLTTGAQAPMLEMQKEQLRAKVNACYGYSAISRIRVTQTSPSGFAEPKEAYRTETADLTPEVSNKAREAVGAVHDPDLRHALEVLARNILTSQKN